MLGAHNAEVESALDLLAHHCTRAPWGRRFQSFVTDYVGAGLEEEIERLKAPSKRRRASAFMWAILEDFVTFPVDNDGDLNRFTTPLRHFAELHLNAGPNGARVDEKVLAALEASSLSLFTISDIAKDGLATLYDLLRNQSVSAYLPVRVAGGANAHVLARLVELPCPEHAPDNPAPPRVATFGLLPTAAGVAAQIRALHCEIQSGVRSSLDRVIGVLDRPERLNGDRLKPLMEDSFRDRALLYLSIWNAAHGAEKFLTAGSNDS